jgi:hypothetical protein
MLIAFKLKLALVCAAGLAGPLAVAPLFDDSGTLDAGLRDELARQLAGIEFDLLVAAVHRNPSELTRSASAGRQTSFTERPPNRIFDASSDLYVRPR